ncbi:hypothetical protein WA026_012215 [Henosepilachna vigintioctopunctata]|uniref:Uncharacterized protein n=1 Tax=Henosepilachna vigintioctopunctata TaxID=420089 RepID=A0AAW1VCV2_9CUCU
MQSDNFTFDKLNNFVTHYLEELYLYEQTFTNQISVEKETMSVRNNAENLQKILISLTGLQCSQEFLNATLSFVNTKLDELNRTTTCVENNLKGPEYFTPRDVIRENVYNFLLYVNSKMQMMGELVNDMNLSLHEMKKSLHSIPFEKLAQVMMKQLNLLEGIENKILFLKEESQRIMFLEMLVMKRFNLKLKPC